MHCNMQYLCDNISRQRGEWLKYRADDQHGLRSKPTCAILLRT